MIEPHLGQYVDIQRDAFCALNTAFVEDGAYIHIRRSAAAEEPIHLLFVSTANDMPHDEPSAQSHLGGGKQPSYGC